jgi:hypothetical protein
MACKKRSQAKEKKEALGVLNPNYLPFHRNLTWKCLQERWTLVRIEAIETRLVNSESQIEKNGTKFKIEKDPSVLGNLCLLEDYEDEDNVEHEKQSGNED